MHAHNNDSCGRSGHGHGHGHGGFGRGFKPPFGPGGFHGHGFGGPGARARRGDVRTAVLLLLTEKPMHGYQIIQELSARSEGAWTPSPGSVYPTLQLLADEDLVVAEEVGGKKIFSLTDSGTAVAAELADQPAPWDEAAGSDSNASEYREAAGKLMQPIFQIGKTGSSEQVTAAIEILNDTRRKLYAILAED